MSKPVVAAVIAAPPAPAEVWSSVPAAPVVVAVPVLEPEDIEVWVPAPQETFTGKLWSKTKQDPFVPIGFLATCACLGMGVYAMGTGNKTRQQTLMRARVGAQAFTLAAFGYGLYSLAQRRPGVSTKQMAREAEAERTEAAQR